VTVSSGQKAPPPPFLGRQWAKAERSDNSLNLQTLPEFSALHSKRKIPLFELPLGDDLDMGFASGLILEVKVSISDQEPTRFEILLADAKAKLHETFTAKVLPEQE
jgi:hypothetical protein